MEQTKHWLEFADDWRNEPMAFWVHIEQDGEPWYRSHHFLPEAPQPIPHKGYAIFCIDYKGYVLRFSSAAQLEECIRVLSLKPLPTSRRLTALRGTTKGPNSHWVSRLPGKLKSPKERRGLVEALRKVVWGGA